MPDTTRARRSLLSEDTHTAEHVAVRDMFSRGVLYSVVYALQATSAVLVTPVITRAIGATQFGIVAELLTIGAVVSAVACMSLQVGIQRHFADEVGDRETRSIVAISSIVSVIITTILATTASEWATLVGLNGEIGALEYGICWAGTFGILTFFSATLRSQDRLRDFIILVSVQISGSQLLGLLFICLVGRSAESYMQGMFIGQMLALIAGIYFVRPWFFRISRSHLAAAYAISIPLLPHSLAIQVLNLGDRVVVQRDLGPVAVARYQLGYNTAAFLIMMLVMLNQAWEPRLFAAKDALLRRAILIPSSRRGI